MPPSPATPARDTTTNFFLFSSFIIPPKAIHSSEPDQRRSKLMNTTVFVRFRQAQATRRLPLFASNQATEDGESTNSTAGFFRFALRTGQGLTIVHLSVTISILDVRSSIASIGKERKKAKLRGAFGDSTGLRLLLLGKVSYAEPSRLAFLAKSPTPTSSPKCTPPHLDVQSGEVYSKCIEEYMEVMAKFRQEAGIRQKILASRRNPVSISGPGF
ncbi:hypothetical protein ACLB2K_013568 [Fragaria x ananassa]